MGSPTATSEVESDVRPLIRSRRSLALWIAVGLIGSIGMVVTGSQVGSITFPGPSHWWFSIPDARSPILSIAFYSSVGILIVGWLGIGRLAFQVQLTPKRAWLVLGAWGSPLYLGPPLFSRDIYSYIGQGLIAKRGLNPYTVGPNVLGHGPLLTSIASVWRTTSSPYGPLFVSSTRLVALVSGHSLISQVLAFRALELIGVALIMVSLPRLARHLGTEPGIALWLGALSPLALFGFISSGHNDALMVGLLVAGVTLAVDGQMLWGLVLCSLAATIKLPAAAAVAFLVVDQFRSSAPHRRWKLAGLSVALSLVVFAGVTVLCGYGWTWLGPKALHIPTELHVLATPAVSLGVLFYRLLNLVGLHVAKSVTVAVTQTICGLIALAGCIWLLLNVHKYEVVRLLGLALLLVVVGSPTVWPWYLLWGIVLLAATTLQRSKVLAVVAALSMLAAAGPSGNPLMHGDWYIVVSLATIAGCAWLIQGQRWRSLVGNVA